MLPDHKDHFDTDLGRAEIILLIFLFILLIVSAVFFIAPCVLSKEFSYSFIAGGFVIICELFLIFKTLRSSTVESFKSSEYLYDVLVMLGIVALLFQ